ncbi:alpha/beta fold hydrolase [Actinomadura algeriensis]|uniref:Pimeloyl-ACP methyl ester carboxylesterase n=1 Tax=Actinomadura algeriensis TaxID=1679523 RepID=A0ABR9K2C9_9ACTN|nr:alpha/beta fold hydrolase [Actinomadura algeriensis]MBE1537006.1 pimeloyl-ACP methyl ester carboxylesterase [Actinomadura algeriensis]
MTRRRGGFFLPGEWDAASGRSVGSAWVQWEAPAVEEEWKAPVILVHGGGGQSTDWMWAVEGQPGWAELFVEAGHPTYLVDRPGHGRSVWDPDRMGGRGPVPDAATLGRLFQVDEEALRADGGAFGPVAASSTGLPADAAAVQRREAACLARLLEQIGPAIVVMHSAGSPGVWLAADRAPELVRLVVAVEPLGPPFGGERHARALSEGLTAIPLEAARGREDGRGGGLARVRVAVVTAGASGHLASDRETVGFLIARGCAVEHLRLDRHGLHGDGHGVIFDRNSTAAFHLVQRHCAAVCTDAPPTPAVER